MYDLDVQVQIDTACARVDCYCIHNMMQYRLDLLVSSKVRLFADDCLIYRNIKNKEDQIALQKDLNLLENWGNTWGVRFNAAKCNSFSKETGGSTYSVLQNYKRFGISALRRRPCRGV